MSIVFVTVLSALLLLPQHEAKAADTGGEYIYFRIDTELDVLNAKGVTVEWSCNGAASGSITDTLAGYASESSPEIDGIVKVATISQEFITSTCVFGSSTIRAKATINGWVTRKWTAVLLASTSVPFTTRASMDYEIIVGPVKNELGQSLTLDGLSTNSHASASYSGTTASSSYNGGYLYIAGTTSGGTVKAESSGFVSRTSTALTISQTASQSVAFDGLSTHNVNASGLDYNLVVGPVTDELDTTITLNTGTASASYSGTAASSSYSGNYKYIAAITDDGTITVGNSGYVSKSQVVTWSGNYETASKSATFDGTTPPSGGYNVGKLQYGVKATLNKKDRTGKTYSNVAGATVTAGTSLGVSCTDHNNGDYYCVVPLAGTGVLASAASIPVGGESENITCTYTDRAFGGDVQSTCTITANEPASGGGNSGGGGSYVAVATPTPTPVPGLSPTPTPTPVSVTLYRKASDPKVYVQGSDGTLSWVKTIEEFNTAGYRWSDVKMISGNEFAQMKINESATPVLAILFRKANDPKVYVRGSDGTLSWVKTIEAFSVAGYSWADVKTISGEEFGKMRVGGNVRVVKGIAFLRVRSGSSTANKMVGKVLPNQELKFTEMKNGWYHIDSGWVFGAYAKEF